MIRRASDWINENLVMKGFGQQPPEPIICWAELPDFDDQSPRSRRGERALYFALSGVFLLAVGGIAAAHYELRARIDRSVAGLAEEKDCSPLLNSQQAHRAMPASPVSKPGVSCALASDNVD